MISLEFPSRPGVSAETLCAAGIRLSATPEPGSIEIPYNDLHGNPTGFCRWRLPRERADGQKYHQEVGSGTRAYIPPQFRSQAPGGDLVIVEGEFKVLSLNDACIKAIGLPSFNTYVRTEGGEPLLLAGIDDALAYTKPARILFLGDSDTATNYAFARNALCLANAVKPLLVLLPRIPVGGPGKGIDDCRAALGEGFSDFWRALVESAEKIDLKAGAGALAVRLLEREAEAIRANVGAERDRHDRRIVRMAAECQEPLARDRIVDFAEKVLGYSRSAFKDAVAEGQRERVNEIREQRKPSGARESEDSSSNDGETTPGDSDTEDEASLFPVPPATPWEQDVDGAAPLDDLKVILCRYVAFPAHAADALVLFIVATYATDCFDAAPYVNLFSPEKRCGKTLTLRLLALICDRALAACRPDLPPELNDRAADLWEPLLAVAEIAGGKWPERARAAALALSGENADLPPTSIGERLLGDIYKIFTQAETDRLASADLCARLSVIEEAPWGEIRKGHPINPNKLARLLKGFAVHSRKVRTSRTETAQGYDRQDFDDAWKRYCPSLGAGPKWNNGTKPVDIGENPLCEVEQPESLFHLGNSVPANQNAPCSVVPVPNVPPLRASGDLVQEVV